MSLSVFGFGFYSPRIVESSMYGDIFEVTPYYRSKKPSVPSSSTLVQAISFRSVRDFEHFVGKDYGLGDYVALIFDEPYCLLEQGIDPIDAEEGPDGAWTFLELDLVGLSSMLSTKLSLDPNNVIPLYKRGWVSSKKKARDSSLRYQIQLEVSKADKPNGLLWSTVKYGLGMLNRKKWDKVASDNPKVNFDAITDILQSDSWMTFRSHFYQWMVESDRPEPPARYMMDAIWAQSVLVMGESYSRTDLPKSTKPQDHKWTRASWVMPSKDILPAPPKKPRTKKEAKPPAPPKAPTKTRRQRSNSV